MTFSYNRFVYRSDKNADQWSRKVRNTVAAVADLGWEQTGMAPGNLDVDSMTSMPRECKPRVVHGRSATGERVALPIATNDAPIYDAGKTSFSYDVTGTGNPVTFQIEGFSGERRTLAKKR